MTQRYNVAVLVGSLRRGSLNRKVARALIEMAPQNLALAMHEIGDLPLYNQDLEGPSPPPAWITFRDGVRKADALLFVTPEYNRSIPGGLKNAIDVGSRPGGQSAWNGKPAAVISVSTGALSAFGANHILRQSLVALNVPAMPHPEAYIGQAAALFDDDGRLVNESTREFLRKFVDAFAQWVERNAQR